MNILCEPEISLCFFELLRFGVICYCSITCLILTATQPYSALLCEGSRAASGLSLSLLARHRAYRL